jgi:hypothetical protein
MARDVNIKVDTYLSGQKIRYKPCKFITTTTKTCSYLKGINEESDNQDFHFWPGINTDQINKWK